MTRITRLEVIDENGRSYVSWEDDNDVSWQFQDKGKTLKIFVNKVKPKTGEEGALEALDKFQNDWLLGKKCPETKLEIKNLNSVESIKAEIKVLQSKLEFYEELEKQPLTLFDVIRNLGYSVDMCYEIVDAVEEFQKPKEPEKEQQIKELVKESVKWCEEHQNESLEDYLRPKTPEQTEKSLKEAFVKAQQTEEWKETQRKIDEEDNDKNFKNSLDLIKEWGEKNKPPTLYEILMGWWINHLDMEQSDEEIVDGLVNIIGEKFIPPSRDRNGYEWEKCLKIMRDKLR
jgi:hypothetical protein